MAAKWPAQICAILSVSFVIQAASTDVTPIQKVVTLLTDLSAKIAAEGKKEAAEYDKFACFCKEQADEKQYAMEKSAQKLEFLGNETIELEAELAKTYREMDQIHREMDTHWDFVDQREFERRTTHKQYMDYIDNEINPAISSCERAVVALKTSKSEMRGAKLDLVQVTANLVHIIKRGAKLAQAKGAVNLLSKIEQPSGPRYEYHSNDILAVLQDLLAEFKDMKKHADEDEHMDKSADEKAILGARRQIAFLEEEERVKHEIGSRLEEKLGENREATDSEKKDAAADKAFTDRLSEECQRQAELFDQRSQMRAGELTALKEATADLSANAVENYEGNKKLVGLQTAAVGKAVKPLSGPMTFVQVNEVTHHRELPTDEDSGFARVRNYLTEAAGRTGSSALSALAVRIQVSLGKHAGREQPTDHFVKVRGLIHNLLEKLHADEVSESTTKSTCDAGIKTATEERDSSNAKIEVATAELTVQTANKNKLEEEKGEKERQISELSKSILEAEELAKEQIDEYDRQRDMLDVAKASVERAITILEKFYHKTALELVQTKKFVPANADREGNTLEDLAPAPPPMDEHYEGAQDESGGIIGILQVILNDCSRSYNEAGHDKDDTEDAKTFFVEEANTDIKKKKSHIQTIELAIQDTISNINQQENALKDAKDQLASALKALDGWHKMCVKGEETWEERAQKRQDEIEALKEASQILEEWQN